MNMRRLLWLADSSNVKVISDSSRRQLRRYVNVLVAASIATIAVAGQGPQHADVGDEADDDRRHNDDVDGGVARL
jgi:hypothetical protein